MAGLYLALLACGGLLSNDQPADRTFMLTSYLDKQGALPTESGHGLVVEVDVVPGLDTDQLLTLSVEAELNHFSGARWPDHLPEFAGSLVRRSLQHTGWFSSVSQERDSGSGDCELKLEVQQFYTTLDGAGAASVVQISMSGGLACEGRIKPLMLNASARVKGSQISNVVAAHQQAMDDLLRSLISQLEEFQHQPEAS